MGRGKDRGPGSTNEEAEEEEERESEGSRREEEEKRQRRGYHNVPTKINPNPRVNMEAARRETQKTRAVVAVQALVGVWLAWPGSALCLS